MRPVRILAAIAFAAAAAAAGSCSTGNRSATADPVASPGPPSASSAVVVSSPRPAKLPPSPRPASVSQATATTPGAGRAGLAAADAVAVARSFLAAEIGMTDLVAGPFQRTTRTTGEVAFRIRHGEGGSLAPPTVPRTVVQLEQAAAGWVVAAVHADAIEVTAPGRLAAISSPVTVTGMASAFEGTVQVAVKAAGPGTGRLLGRGFVTGSGSATPGPFHGSIAFSQPSTGTGTGWIIFYEGNEASEASPVLQATAVRIRFAGHR